MTITRERNKFYKEGGANKQLEFISREIEQERYRLVIEDNLLKQKLNEIIGKSQMVTDMSNKNI